MSSVERVDVLIVGYGPAGAVAATLLGQAGVRVRVVDRAHEIYPKPRAFALDHEIMRVFQQLGIADALAPHTAPFLPSEYYGVDGTLIKRLATVEPPWPLAWTPSLVFNQPALEATLRERVSALPSVAVTLGDELVAFNESVDGVRARLRDDAGHEHSVEAGWLIGCDGASSTVRRLCGIGQEDLGFDEPWLVVDLRVASGGAPRLPGTCVQYCEPERPATFLIGTGTHRRFEIALRADEDPKAMERPERVMALLERWLAPGEAELWRAASYRFHALVAERWQSTGAGRVLLAGDAAHQQPPFLGQGMCQAIRDVANLCWKLERVIRGRSSPALLATYERERRPHVRALTTLIKGIGGIVSERDPQRARARDAKLIAEAGGTIRTQPRQDLIPPLHDGLLSPEPHAARGTLFPQPWVSTADGMRRLDDAAGGGLRVVTDHRIDAARLAAHPALQALGARHVAIGAGAIAERDGVAAAWFERHGCAAAIVRPDHYVYSVAGDHESLEQQLDRLLEELQ
ncbi:MAG: bifunctional 3-(3-hydroxy-phenyl)propionate/3-hydroxycinnamic acid hydroxylase [Burkholderiales bacterium]|nr:bifunctional 3-(3-hydroxy-phenyl)propionate/3-hydroxycinnamic acid hydroxylase [Burkholderiales bacterium]